MKRQIPLIGLMLVAYLAITANLGKADTTYVSGTLFGEWNLDGSPYIVTGDITIPPWYGLIITAGVEVLFQGPHRILADSSIICAYGTATDSVIFRPMPGVAVWGSIHILNTPLTKQCAFIYCLFEKADGASENDRWGGAFYALHGDIRYENCRFQYNHAYTGAGIFGHLSDVTFINCELFHNYNDWKGGAINFNTCDVEINHTAICHNTAVYEAGGIYAWSGDINIINCTIANNAASNGGGIFNYPGGTYLEIVNTIIYNNYGGNITGPGYSNVTYSDVGGGWSGTGNINVDPMFVNPGFDNYHLLPDSPCIDAGDPNSPPDPDGTVADMGAYYYDQTGPGGNIILDLIPVNPPIIIPSQGGSFNYLLLLVNTASYYLICDYWADFLLPDGQVIGPYFLRPNIYLASQDSILRQMGMHLSAGAMSGTYQYRGYAGEFPDTAWVSDYFSFVKLSAGGNTTNQNNGYIEMFGWDKTEYHLLPAWGNGEAVVNTYELEFCNAPEPFNPQTIFQFSMPSDGNVQLLIYDLSGRLVATLLDRFMAAGAYGEAWDASQMPSGMYLARLVTPDGMRTERCMLVK